MVEKIVDTNAYVSVLRELAEEGRVVSMQIAGSSMSPFLCHRRDYIYFTRSEEELKRRLKGRNSETDEEIERRLSRMEYEFSKKDEYDYIVVNDALDGAESKLEEIIDKEKNR